jgi:hypothetical protein
MSRTRRRSRAANSARSPLVANDQAVRTAEAIVCRAWAEELLRQRDHEESAVNAALAACDIARQRLSAAQRDGDPRKISLAHAALEHALETGRTSMLARDRGRQTLSADLDLPARTTRERMISALVRQLEHDGPVITAGPLQAPDPEAGQALPDPPEPPGVAGPERERRVPVPRWLGRLLLMRRAASLEQP